VRHCRAETLVIGRQRTLAAAGGGGGFTVTVSAVHGHSDRPEHESATAIMCVMHGLTINTHTQTATHAVWSSQVLLNN